MSPVLPRDGACRLSYGRLFSILGIISCQFAAANSSHSTRIVTPLWASSNFKLVFGATVNVCSSASLIDSFVRSFRVWRLTA
ncbi:hypothetical protein V8F20_007231 [Naviculisporaceae sp. PSN 640]